MALCLSFTYKGEGRGENVCGGKVRENARVALVRMCAKGVRAIQERFDMENWDGYF